MTPVEDELSIWRDPPPRPYVATGRILHVPTNLLQATYGALAPYRKAGVEACCFWYGTRETDEVERAVALILPRQRNYRGSFDIGVDTVAATAAATRPRGWLNLAQIHTHPGVDVEHSRYDDGHANSRRALSIVLPRYGDPKADWPDDIGVHEFVDDYWYLLVPDQARHRLNFVSDLPVEAMDLR